jgi:hypothetical protein
VREEDGPFVTNELVEVDLTLGGFGLEVGCGRPEAEAVGTVRSLILRSDGRAERYKDGEGAYLGLSSVAIAIY